MRFYLQQSLLVEEGDPHRTLGVAPGADIAVLRRHHKLLQAWLHPDRNADPWNEVFATRVNQAWSALRSDRGSARQAENATAAATAATAAVAPAAARPMAPAGHWSAFEVPGGNSRARWLALAGVAACAVLLVMHLLVEPAGPRRPHAADAPAVEVLVADAQASPVAEVLAAPLPVQAAPLPVQAAAPATSTPAAVPTRHRQEPRTPAPAPSPPALDVAAASPGPTAPPVRKRTPVQPETVLPPPTQPQPIVVARSPQQTVAAEPINTAPAVGATPVADPLLRMREAQASLRATLAFLSRDNGAPPLWNDPRAAEQANRQRDALHRRVDVRRVELTASHWVLRDGDARVDASYATGGNAGEQGRLALRLVRREGRWLVSGLQLEPTG